MTFSRDNFLPSPAIVHLAVLTRNEWATLSEIPNNQPDNLSRMELKSENKFTSKHPIEEPMNKKEKEIEELSSGKYDRADADIIAIKRLPS